ncbi:MAG: two-component sensor histidine kinase [Lachnospiraceae bacterium]|nr:two-component sensor histidine kinase [Lachnospiraceae bacterium]
MKQLWRHSIKFQLAAVVILLVIGTIFACWVINSSFLETYYVDRKESSLIAVYDRLNAAYVDGTINDSDFDIELQQICGRFNINMLVLDENSETFKATMHDSDFLKRRLIQDFFQKRTDEAKRDIILETTEQYTLRRTMDPMIRTEFLEMLGFLKNGNLFFLRTPIESIRESVQIANQFLGFIGTVAVLVSAVAVWFVSKKVTEPVSELFVISDKMKNLDFNTKYTGKRENEIGALGENINELSETLEKTISELKTANSELQQDVERKTQIDEMRKDFLSNVSHELKTPIALIQGYAEGLKEGISDDPESREYYCDVIVDESKKMNELVQKLLTLNQIEFGKSTVSVECFDVREMIDTFVRSADILLRSENITCTVEGDKPCNIWADESMMEDVFRNFFSNAIHYCKGEKKIVVRTFKVGEKTRISVFNTGDHIPEESLEHVWEKFYKVDKARTREYGGSGIGLSIVKAMMDAMNGTYGVHNCVSGVEFWVEV